MNTRTLTKTAATLALAATAAIGLATPAMAGNNCKKVSLEFANNYNHKINIVDIDYWDPAKGRNGGWRSIGVFNETLQPGAEWDETRTLQKVNERLTKVRFEFRKPGKLGGWSFKKYSRTSDEFTCARRAEVAVTAKATTSFLGNIFGKMKSASGS